jgi:hypothetical protein
LSAAKDEISVRQRTVAETTVALAGEIGSFPAFVLALRRAAEYMGAAARLLEEDGSQGQAARPQAAALRSLEQILMAISQPPPQQPSASDANSNDRDQTGKAAQRAGAGREQLQLLRIMQQYIATQTIEIDTTAQRRGMLDTVQRQDLIQLGKQQAELADVVRLLASPASDENEPVDDENSDVSDVESKLRQSLQQLLDKE